MDVGETGRLWVALICLKLWTMAVSSDHGNNPLRSTQHEHSSLVSNL
jgi:hypothetical protein